MALIDANIINNQVSLGGQHFELLKKLGAGKCGSVFLAKNTATGERICIKKDSSLERATLEAKAILNVYGHPSAVATINNYHYFTQPYFKGNTLKDVRGQLTLWEKLIVADKIKEDLQRVHEKGYLHRDLKSNNIIVDVSDIENIQVHIIDLGRSVKRDADKNELRIHQNILYRLCQDHTAPEYIYGGEINESADYYSYGKVLRALFPSEYHLVQKLIGYDIPGRRLDFSNMHGQLESVFAKEKNKLLCECNIYANQVQHGDLSVQVKAEIRVKLITFKALIQNTKLDDAKSLKVAQAEYVRLKTYLKSIDEAPKTFLQRIKMFFYLFGTAKKPVYQWIVQWLQRKEHQIFKPAASDDQSYGFSLGRR